MLDEDELQRRELSRLLGTAKDEERKDLIRQALQSLDSHEKGFSNGSEKVNPHHLNPSIHASVFVNNGLPTVEVRNARLRPASARRRPSMANLLDAIPESSHASNRKEIELSVEEIAEVVSSSYDPLCPPDSLFQPNGGSPSSPNHSVLNLPIPEDAPGLSSHARCWITTGLVPQFVSITFYEKWWIRRVQVRCQGVERLAVHVNYSTASAFSTAKLVPCVRKSEGLFEAEVAQSRASLEGLSLEEVQGVQGMGLMVVIQQSHSLFCSISQVRVIVCPQNR
eukprot:gene1872-2049_t